MNILNQSGKVFNPDEEVKAHVTFEVINTGTHKVEIDTSLFNNLQLTNAEDTEKVDETVVIEVGGRVTISGDTSSSTISLSANAVEGISSLKVRGSAVLFHDVESESNAVHVYTDYVEANLPYHYEAEIVNKEAKDTDDNGANDQIILTFGKEVFDFEAGDFYIHDESGRSYGATQVIKDEKKLILLFSEDTLSRNQSS